MSRLVASLFLFAAEASAGNTADVQQAVLRAGPVESIVMKSDNAKSMRICNAYAGQPSLSIRNIRMNQDLGMLAYKECVDHKLPLLDGDEIQFRTKDSIDIGTFAVSGLPKTQNNLLLIVSNKKDHSALAAFKSHAFGAASESGAQVAVVDTFIGEVNNEHLLQIEDNAQPDQSVQSVQRSSPENLPFNAVVSVSPGQYNVQIAESGRRLAAKNFEASPGTNYVVIRVGGAADTPEDVVVFPQIKSYARRAASLGLCFLCALLWQ